MGAFSVLALVLAIRLALILSIVGAFVLTYIAIVAPDPWRLGALGIYSLAVVIPTVWLSSRR
jgi:hypothetical protein